jgi:WD40 repeat protein
LTLPCPGAVDALCPAPDDQRLAVINGGMVSILEACATPERLTLTGHRGHIDAAGFSLDGRRIFSAVENDAVRVWNAHSGEPILALKIDNKTHASATYFSNGGRHVVLEQNDAAADAEVWDVETGKRVENAPLDGSRGEAKFSPDQRLRLLIDGEVLRVIALDPPPEVERERRRFCTAPDLAWHEKQASFLEGLNQWHGAAFHRERLALSEPWDPNRWLQHAQACSRAGRNDRAAVSYLQSILLTPPARQRR